MNSKYKSIKSLLNRILRNPMMEDINRSDLAQMVGDAIKLIGVPGSYVEETCDLDIANYKARLPDALIYIVQTLYRKDENSDYYATRVATNTFATKYHEIGTPDFNTIHEITYSVNDHFIHFDQETGQTKILYKAIKTDAEGLPMIPDLIQFEKAIEAYVKQEHYRVLWELGKIPDKVMQKAEQEYTWYVGAAETAGRMMTIDEAESFAASFSKLLLKPLQQQELFHTQGSRQYLKSNRI